MPRRSFSFLWTKFKLFLFLPFPFPIDLSLLSRIPGRPYKEPAEIKVERDDSLDRESKDFSKQSSSKAKRKHKVQDSMEQVPVLVLCCSD